MFKSPMLKWIMIPLAAVGGLALIGILLVASMALFRVASSGSSYAYPSESITALSDYGGSSRSFLTSADVAYEAAEESFYGDDVLLDDGTAVEPKIIKTGYLELVVEDVDTTADDIATISREAGGYIESANVYEKSDGTRTGTVVVRVPVESFDEVMEGAKGYAELIERENSSAEDVTEDYVDILARLNNAEAQEEAYLDILSLATDVEDVLAVQRELQYIRETIEVYQGRLNYLDSQTSLSTITISLSEEPTVEIAGREFRPGTTVKLAAQALVLLVQGIINLIIWIVIIGGGLGLPITLLVWLIIRAIKQRKQRK